MHQIPFADKKRGDALYFPGHIALYLGEGRYIHSTGASASGGVVINSLDPADPLYREDLVKSLYAVGSVFYNDQVRLCSTSQSRASPRQLP